MSASPIEFRAEHATKFGIAQFLKILAWCTDVNVRGPKGRTALFLAARVGRDAHVAVLLQKGADPNLTDGADEAPLQVAARYGHTKCVELLLNAGAEIDHIPAPQKSEYSESALRSAVWHRAHETAVLLLARGANPNATGTSKRYPLAAAAVRDNAELCRRLVESGAALNFPDKTGARPLCDALSFASLETLRTLLELGADPNAIGSQGRRPLSTALFREEGDCVPLLYELLRAKADIKLRNEDGSTALEWAKKLENDEAGELFRSLGGTVTEETSPGSAVIEIRDGATVEILVGMPGRFASTDSDKEIAKRLSAMPAGVLRNYGWEASPRHWTILRTSDQPITLDRMGYFARGYFNVTKGRELDDGPLVLGESYQDAATRFVQLGLLRTLTVSEALGVNANGDELRKLARQHGLRPPARKDDLVDIFVAQLPAMAEEIARRKVWYRRTDLGTEQLHRLGDERASLKVVLRLVEHLHAAAVERNLTGMLLVHLDLRSACGECHPRHLNESTVTSTRRVMHGDWPDNIRCNEADVPALRTVACVANLVGDEASGLLGWDWIRWNYFGPLKAPRDEFGRRLGPGDIIYALTVDPA